MAPELGHRHVCRLPRPKDRDAPERHACECGQQWIYQPTRWNALYTVSDLWRQQEAGALLRDIISSFSRVPPVTAGDTDVIGSIVTAKADAGSDAPTTGVGALAQRRSRNRERR